MSLGSAEQTESGSTSGVGSETFRGLVLQVFCRPWSKWPLAVAIDLGKYFVTAFSVNPGQVAYCWLRMAVNQVVGTGLPAAACRYWIKSCLFVVL
jgi:hypothetical protein